MTTMTLATAGVKVMTKSPVLTDILVVFVVLSILASAAFMISHRSLGGLLTAVGLTLFIVILYQLMMSFGSAMDSVGNVDTVEKHYGVSDIRRLDAPKDDGDGSPDLTGDGSERVSFVVRGGGRTKGSLVMKGDHAVLYVGSGVSRMEYSRGLYVKSRSYDYHGNPTMPATGETPSGTKAHATTSADAR